MDLGANHSMCSHWWCHFLTRSQSVIFSVGQFLFFMAHHEKQHTSVFAHVKHLTPVTVYSDLHPSVESFKGRIAF